MAILKDKEARLERLAARRKAALKRQEMTEAFAEAKAEAEAEAFAEALKIAEAEAEAFAEFGSAFDFIMQ